MKTKLLMILCLGVALTACKKNTVKPLNISIKGTWELRATRNGNIIPATYPQDNGHLLAFADITFAQYSGGTLIDSGRYTKTSSGVYAYDFVSTLGENAFVNHVMFKGDTLLVIPGQPDISTAYYVKTSNSPLDK